MDFDTCLRVTRYRVFLAWQNRLDYEWERPSLSDNYLIQLTAEVRLFRYAICSIKKDFTFKDLQLKPDSVKDSELGNGFDWLSDPEVIEAITMARWQAAGFKLVRVEDEEGQQS